MIKKVSKKKKVFKKKISQKEKKIELLAPISDNKSLNMAINAGADAVYLGLKNFSARNFATNFSTNELLGLTSKAHSKGVRVYVAMNTLIKNHEINKYFDFMRKAYNANIDAVIIQEPSFVPIIKKNFPNLQVHLSTQANVHNYNSLQYVKDVDRVILARELSVKEIEIIKGKVKTDLEAFVHGALCFCYSGQCLMSGMIGRRSGNRGKCAQPCRRKYNGSYLLSTKDLCLIEHIPELIKSGIMSFKIEGRMRSPEYVYTTVSIYRKAIDSYYDNKFKVTNDDIDKLKQAFNREYTSGYFKENKAILASEKPMNRGIYLGVYNNGMIKLEHNVTVGDGIGIWKKNKVVGNKINYICMFGTRVLNAKKGAIVQTDIDNAENGDKIYKTSDITVQYPVIKYKRTPIKFVRKSINKVTLPVVKKVEPKKGIKFHVKLKSLSDIKDAVKYKPETIYFDLFSKDIMQAKKAIPKGKFYVYTQKILDDKEIESVMKKLGTVKPDGILVSDVGLLNKKLDCKVHLDISLNVFNDYDASYYKHTPIISPELNSNELKKFAKKDFLVFAHGKIPVMTTKFLLEPKNMKDEKKVTFTADNNGKYSHIYNSCDIGFFLEIKKLEKEGITNFFFDLEKDVDETMKLYTDIASGKKVNIGNKRRGYTTGHLFRGVY